ncbi:hypothetical protein [Nocardia rhizosphaerihabitans]|uniref:hypothetical protein n=1 Tax=Nocardia rhizosphaerihabitans TaxID=1691570 RepID=UPI0016657F09|nr:hypothetical protein [Nocardia rhizosphaerihabitans]
MNSMIAGWPNKLHEYLPMLEGWILPKTGDPTHIRGDIFWNGSGVRLDKAVNTIYGGQLKWMTSRYGGVTWIDDEVLLGMTGLRYVVLESVGINPSTKSVHEHRIWLFDGDSQRVYSSRTDPHQFRQAVNEITADGHPIVAAEFLALHSASADQIVREYTQ